MKPVFNYELSVADRINQITNQSNRGIIKLIFPASDRESEVSAMLRSMADNGFCILSNDGTTFDNSGTDQDLYYEVLVSDMEQYRCFMAHLLTVEVWTWGVIPIAVTYIPSKEEVGL